MDHSFPKKVYQASSAWSKGWPDQKNDKLNYVEYNDNYNWISTWSKNHGLLIVKKISPFLIISFFYLLFICLKCKKIHLFKRKAHKENSGKLTKSFKKLHYSAIRIMNDEKKSRIKITNFNEAVFFP